MIPEAVATNYARVLWIQNNELTQSVLLNSLVSHRIPRPRHPARHAAAEVAKWKAEREQSTRLTTNYAPITHEDFDHPRKDRREPTVRSRFPARIRLEA
jgi:hypothetical protein